MKKFGFVLVISLLSVGGVWAQTPDSLAFVEEIGWPPFTDSKAGLTNTGLSYDVVSEVGRRLGKTVSLELMPFARALNLVQTGSKDGLTATSKNAERETFMVFSDPYVNKTGLVFIQKSRTGSLVFQSLEDLKGKKVGVVRGNSYGDEINGAIKSGSLVVDESADLATAFRKLALGRLDMVLAVNFVAAELFKQEEFKGAFVALPKAYQNTTYHIALSKKTPAQNLIPEINKALAAMQADGTLKRILGKYGL